MGSIQIMRNTSGANFNPAHHIHQVRYWFDGDLPDGSKFVGGASTKKAAWRRLTSAIADVADRDSYFVWVTYETCFMGKDGASYDCKFCYLQPLHRGDDDCNCSTFRPQTRYATLCLVCAEALDKLNEDTPIGRVHKALIYAADCAGRPSSD